MMLVLYHTSFYVPSELSLRDSATWSVPNGAVKAASLLWIGVPIFFVVSGFCIAASVGARPDRPYSLKTYFGRRFWRIYPPLWLACLWAVGVTWLISALWPGLHHACVQLPRWDDWSIWNWVGNISATESWQHHVTGTKPHYLMKNTWTLCYEEQFYAVVGLLLLAANRRFFTGAVLLCLLTLVCRHVGRWHGVDQAGCFFEGHWLLFAAGIALYYQLTRASRLGWWGIELLFVAGMAYAAIDRSHPSTNFAEKHLDEYLFVACAFAILLGGLHRWDLHLMKARLLQPLQWCGKRSYSIYLTHFPVVVALSCFLAQAGCTTPLHWLQVTIPLSIGVSIALGWLFHILIERHFVNAPVS